MIPWTVAHQAPLSWDSPGKNIGVGCHALLQGIFPTQGSNPGLPALQADFLPSEPAGKPKDTGEGSLSLLQWNLPDPGIEPGFPALQVDSLPFEPPGKLMNTGVGSLFLLQEVFPAQESNWGLLHCRQILYQLSYQGIPASNRLFEMKDHL